jgi:hypothetical protein
VETRLGRETLFTSIIVFEVIERKSFLYFCLPTGRQVAGFFARLRCLHTTPSNGVMFSMGRPAVKKKHNNPIVLFFSFWAVKAY